MKVNPLPTGFFLRRSNFWMDMFLKTPIEDDLDKIKREVAEIKKELNALLARLTSGKPYRDPRITFPRPQAIPSKLDKPFD